MIHRFKAISSRIPAEFFAEIDKLILKSGERSRITKTIMLKNKVGGLTIPNFKFYSKASVIKIVWYWHKDRNIGQWKKVESPKINPYIYGQLIFSKGAKPFNEEQKSFQQITGTTR